MAEQCRDVENQAQALNAVRAELLGLTCELYTMIAGSCRGNGAGEGEEGGEPKEAAQQRNGAKRKRSARSLRAEKAEPAESVPNGEPREHACARCPQRLPFPLCVCAFSKIFAGSWSAARRASAAGHRRVHNFFTM